MRELTHPVELRDQDLDLIAAGGGNHNGGDKCCGGDNDTTLINIEDNDINVLNNVNVLSVVGRQSFES